MQALNLLYWGRYPDVLTAGMIIVGVGDDTNVLCLPQCIQRIQDNRACRTMALYLSKEHSDPFTLCSTIDISSM